MFYEPEYIILHHSLTKDSETVSWSAIREYHMDRKGWRNIGYHYGIELVKKTPEIFIGRFEGDSGAHTRNYNKKSIGICLVGNYDLEQPSYEKWDLLLRLTKNIAFRYEIPIEHILGHRQIANYKSCPGKLFDLDKFRDNLSQQL